MTEHKTEEQKVFQCPIAHFTSADLKGMFDEQRSHIDKRFDAQQILLLEHASSMGAHVVQGFEKVGDKLVAEIKDMKNNLLPSATNERKVDIKVVMPIIYTLCGVIGSLIIWFTGVKPFIPQVANQEAPIHHEQPAGTSK